MKKTLIVTHSGSFHSDDVFAVAALLLWLAKESITAEVLRSREPKDCQRADYVVDVGGEYDISRNRFDHHQPGGGGSRPEGIPYASFGLVWKQIGPALAGSDEVAQAIDRKLVMPIDAPDNGIAITESIFPELYPYIVANAISAFEPDWTDKNADFDGAFMEAVAFAKGILAREIKKTAAEVKSRALVIEAYERAADKRLIVFDTAFNEYTIHDILHAYPEPLYFIYPQHSRWHLKAVRKNPASFELKKPFPEKWAGKKDAELAAVTGVADAIFCHRNLFLVVALTKQGAMKLAELALAD